MKNIRIGLFAPILIFISGCAHYPINKPLQTVNPQFTSQGSDLGTRENSKDLLLLLSFSGGGTRAAAFAYGVLKELKDTEVTIDGRKRRLLDEVDAISAVSGGSFTAAYYGLFGDRIFEDFESRFLKKDIQEDLTKTMLFNPLNWFRLFSPFFDRSDLAAEYYDKKVFAGGTFGDMLKRKGPAIVINATDMTYGSRFIFTPDAFNAICSDLSAFPVGRACAASSAVPVVLSPITLKNFAGSCGFKMPKEMAITNLPSRKYTFRESHLSRTLSYLDAEKKPYIHLIDGGVSDNLGLRSALDRNIFRGNIWPELKRAGLESVRKVVFIVVNAEAGIDTQWDRSESIPPLAAMVHSSANTALELYNVETLSLLQESFVRWSDEIRINRCPPGRVSTEPGSCGDIKFYLIEVKFEVLGDGGDRSYLQQVPTSFRLKPLDVDRLGEAARRIIQESPEFKEFLQDIVK